MGSMQATQRKEQQGQQQLAAALRGTREHRAGSCQLTRGDRRLQGGQQPRLIGGCQ